jgi:hypothetical protein
METSDIIGKVVVITDPAVALGKAPRSFSRHKEQELS